MYLTTIFNAEHGDTENTFNSLTIQDAIADTVTKIGKNEDAVVDVKKPESGTGLVIEVTVGDVKIAKIEPVVIEKPSASETELKNIKKACILAETGATSALMSIFTK